MNLADHLRRQFAWAERTFGPADAERMRGIVAHIRKELAEIEAAPHDVMEWVDVLILAFHGAHCAGHSPDAIVAALAEKQVKNEARKWPDWRKAVPGQPIEHVREDDGQ